MTAQSNATTESTPDRLTQSECCQNQLPKPEAHSRVRLTDRVLTALLADFEVNGAWAIERMRLEEPTQYVRMIVSLLPNALINDFEQHRLSEASQMPIDKLNDYARGKLMEQAVKTISENPGSIAHYSR